MFHSLRSLDSQIYATMPAAVTCVKSLKTPASMTCRPAALWTAATPLAASMAALQPWWWQPQVHKDSSLTSPLYCMSLTIVLCILSSSHCLQVSCNFVHVLLFLLLISVIPTTTTRTTTPTSTTTTIATSPQTTADNVRTKDCMCECVLACEWKTRKLSYH